MFDAERKLKILTKADLSDQRLRKMNKEEIEDDISDYNVKE